MGKVDPMNVLLNFVREYVDQSEVRIVNDRLRFRMLPDKAKRFDKGLYDNVSNFWSGIVEEISQIKIKYPDNKESIFYVYFVQNDFFAKSHIPEFVNIVGKPVCSFDEKGFKNSLAYIQSALDREWCNDEKNVFNRITKLHECAHLIHSNFGSRERFIDEGFAEVVPWYILGYEKRVSTHLTWMRALPKIHTVSDFLNNGFPYEKRFGKKIASYKSGYVSAYLFCRAVISGIENKFKISPCKALQKFLDFWYDTKCYGKDFIIQLAKFAEMDADKLIYTTEYQNAVMNDIERENKKNVIIDTKERDL